MTSRYETTGVLSERGFLRTHTIVDTATHARRVGVSTAEYLPRDERAERLGALRAAHARAAGDGVPGVVDTIDDVAGRSVVVLESEAVIDGAGLITRLDAKGVRFPPEVASALLERVAAILMRVHALPTGPGESPIVLGVLEPRNVLFPADGRLELVGFGLAPFALDNCPMVPVAPELAMQRRLTPKVDVFATFCFAQSVARSLEFAPRLRRAHFGGGGPVEARMRALIENGNRAVWGVPPELRPSMELGASMWRQLWKLSGIKPDPLALRQFLLAHVPQPDARADAALVVWRVARDGAFVEAPDGHRIDLRSRHVGRRILLRLVEARCESGITDRAAPVDVWRLADAAWPGERIVATAATNRVYVAISRMRAIGLGELIDHVGGDAGGYRVRPGVGIEFV